MVKQYTTIDTVLGAYCNPTWRFDTYLEFAFVPFRDHIGDVFCLVFLSHKGTKPFFFIAVLADTERDLQATFDTMIVR